MMTDKSINNKRRFRFFSILCVMSLLITGGCSGSRALRAARDEQGDYSAVNAGAEYHFATPEKYSGVAKSEAIELFVDSATGGIAIADTQGAGAFFSLSEAALEKGLSANLIFKLWDGDGRSYLLNTQDNSVCFGTFFAQKGEGSLELSYSLALDKAAAVCAFSEVPKGELRLDVKLLLTLGDSVVYATVNCADIALSDGYVLESITVLPSFGVLANCVAGDCFLLPDGCGALINLSAVPTQDERYMLCYAGEDVATDSSGCTRAYLPFFAVKDGGFSVSALAEEGDALMSMVLERSAEKNGGALYPLFTVTHVSELDGKMSAGATYSGELKLAYTFSRGEDFDYCGMGALCREQLIRADKLPMQSIEASDNTPFLLTAAAALSDSSKDSYTSLSEAREMLRLLKAKGVNLLALKYSGMLSGGLEQKSITDADKLSFLGGASDEEALTSYAQVQHLEVFFEVNLLSSGGEKPMKTLGGNKCRQLPANTLTKAFFADTQGETLCRLSELEDRISAALELFPDSNIAIGDASSVLYSDYSSGELDRQESMMLISDACKVFDVSGNIWLSSPALYLLRHAKYTDGMPMAASLAGVAGVSSVPLLQIVLHGSLYYAGEPLNFGEDMNITLLKCVEYGCVPSALLTYGLVQGHENMYCVNYSPALAEAYTRVNTALSDLYGERITAHNEVFEGVFCTEYANTSLVYVNYTSESVEINGITLNAADFIRIN